MKEENFTVITVALDRDPEDVRPYIEAADPDHPSLVDTKHVLADRYSIVNVPTVFWIDEEGRMVRPRDVAFGREEAGELTGVDTRRHVRALRRWVRGEEEEEEAVLDPGELDANRHRPTETECRARAEFALGQWLYERGKTLAARSHFRAAGEMAPHDWTIRRGSLRMLDKDPFGEEFFDMLEEWSERGNTFYNPLADLQPNAAENDMIHRLDQIREAARDTDRVDDIQDPMQ